MAPRCAQIPVYGPNSREMWMQWSATCRTVKLIGCGSPAGHCGIPLALNPQTTMRPAPSVLWVPACPVYKAGPCLA